MKRLTLIVGILALSKFLMAAPSVTSVSGTVSNGQSVTIAGSSFGTKDVTAQVYEDFETGSINAYWNSNSGLIISSTATQRHAFSTKDGYHNFTSADSHNAFLTGSNTTLSDKWFVSYWFFLYSNWNWQNGVYPDPPKFLSNIKFFRLWNPGSTTEDFFTATQGWENQSIAVCDNTGDSTRYYLTDYPNVYFATNTWHHVEFAFQENSALGAADGKYQMWVDGASVVRVTNLITRLNDDVLKRPYNVGFYNSWGPNEGTPDASDVSPNEFAMDDIYVSTNLARVEIGDNATYASCTHREVQLPTEWADGSVTTTVKQGSFANSATAYVFVVDSNGVASTGYPITFGATVNPPSSVTNPGIWGLKLQGITITR